MDREYRVVSSHSAPRPPMKLVAGGFGLVVAALLVFTTYYTVPAESAGVVLRFGKYVETAQPGLHFKLPYGIERAHLVPTARVLKEEFGFRTVAAAQRTRSRRAASWARACALLWRRTACGS